MLDYGLKNLRNYFDTIAGQVRHMNRQFNLPHFLNLREMPSADTSIIDHSRLAFCIHPYIKLSHEKLQPF